MPLYEFVLRVEGRPDETLIGERNGLEPGDRLTLRYRPWRVVAVEHAPSPSVAARIVLTPEPFSQAVHEPDLP